MPGLTSYLSNKTQFYDRLGALARWSDETLQHCRGVTTLFWGATAGLRGIGARQFRRLDRLLIMEGRSGHLHRGEVR